MSEPLPEGVVRPLVEPCPGCGATIDVRRITSTSPNIRVWTCVACQTNGAVSTLDPSSQPFLDRLAATVERLSAPRSVLRRIIALADDSATLSNGELRNRLTALTQACACVRVLTTPPDGG